MHAEAAAPALAATPDRAGRSGTAIPTSGPAFEILV